MTTDYTGMVVSNEFDDVYELLEPLGSGGEAQVYRARSVRDRGRDVAVKIFDPSRADPLARMQPEKVTSNLFKRMTNAKASPYVGKFIDVDRLPPPHRPDETTSAPATWMYLVMELVPGIPLWRVVAHGSVVEMRPIATAALGLAALHKDGLVHGDVKPGNILVEARPAQSVGRLVDLGAARRIGTTPEAGLPTSVPYTSPRAGTEPAHPRHDFYSLAMVALYCIARGKPRVEDVDHLLARAKQLFDEPARETLAKALDHAYLTSAEAAEAFQVFNRDPVRPTSWFARTPPGPVPDDGADPEHGQEPTPTGPDLAPTRGSRAEPTVVAEPVAAASSVEPGAMSVPSTTEALIPVGWSAFQRTAFRSWVWLGSDSNYATAFAVCVIAGVFFGLFLAAGQ